MTSHSTAEYYSPDHVCNDGPPFTIKAKEIVVIVCNAYTIREPFYSSRYTICFVIKNQSDDNMLIKTGTYLSQMLDTFQHRFCYAKKYDIDQLRNC